MKTYLIYLIGWFGLLIIAVLNGGLRDNVYGPHMSKLSAHQLSTLIGITLFGAFIWYMTGMFRIESTKQAWVIGIMWLIMTVIFEFGFFHYVMKHPWSELLDAYNLLKGKVWILVLIWTLIAPYLFFLIRSK